MNWWVHRYYHEDPLLLVSWIVWVIVSIVLHELAHGWMALYEGDDTPKRLGHLTINPLVHIPPFSWLLFVLVGAAWGLMPVSPQRFRHGAISRIRVAAAGPLMNLLLATITLVGCALWIQHTSASEPLRTNVAEVLFLGARLNVLLGIFNLIPFPPLDGSTILAALSRKIRFAYENPQYRQAGLVILMVLGFLGAFSFLFAFTDTLTLEALGWLKRHLPS